MARWIILIAVLFIVAKGSGCELHVDQELNNTSSPNANDYGWLVHRAQTYRDLTEQLGLWNTLEGKMRAEVVKDCALAAYQYNLAAEQSKAQMFLDKKLPHELDIENCQ